MNLLYRFENWLAGYDLPAGEHGIEPYGAIFRPAALIMICVALF